ncbi:MAG: quinone-dependent dihydroorotate dehydrogenase [Bacteroidota bacterium]|nr:quinone-dependent dihydroorotate dehydrogenase [Bacteroidota bacterium]
MSFYSNIIKKLFFQIDAEKAHYLAMSLLKIAVKMPFSSYFLKSLFQINNPKLETKAFGLTFKNQVGLAAGFDKNGAYIDELAALGFGFVEVGTVTPLAQEGNPKPRLFRLLKDDAIINRMGFNNEGLEPLVNRLKKRKSDIIIGGNIGKNKNTPNENAIDDYHKCFEALFDFVDYFVVNVSSPNTPNLRELQEKEPLTRLLTLLDHLNSKLAAEKSTTRKPILLKIAPDLTTNQLDEIIEIIRITGTSGIVATNTTITRHNLKTDNQTIEQIGMGGLSGKPVKLRSTEIVRYIHHRSGGLIPIIGVGGIHSDIDALEKINAGASLVQVYTGFVYEGPGIVKNILKGILLKK